MRLAIKLAMVLALLAGAMYLFAYPARTYLGQKREIAAQERSLSVLDRENAKLNAERAALQNNATIEQIARLDYGFVFPGQQAYMVLPAQGLPAHPPHRPQRHKPWYSSLEFWDQL